MCPWAAEAEPAPGSAPLPGQAGLGIPTTPSAVVFEVPGLRTESRGGVPLPRLLERRRPEDSPSFDQPACLEGGQ